MTWRFRPDEPLHDAFRRVAEEEIDRIRALLSDRAGDRAKAIHQSRQGFKRLRALARLAAPALGPDTFARENVCWRDAGRLLSGSRDRTVLSETLDKVAASCAAEISHEAVERIREAVLAAGSFVSTEAVEEHIGEVLAMLDAARARSATLQWPADAATLAAGFRESQARLRKAWKQARKDSTPDRLHRWRKRVKDQASQLRLLRLVMPDAFEALRGEEKETAERLGTDHDLWMLSERLRAALPRDLEAPRDTLLEAIAKGRQRLQREAFKKGERFSAKKPERFAALVIEAWAKRSATIPTSRAK
jgi:CHAD domain-containing protein